LLFFEIISIVSGGLKKKNVSSQKVRARFYIVILHWIPAFAGMTGESQFSWIVIPAKAGIQHFCPRLLRSYRKTTLVKIMYLNINPIAKKEES